MASKYEFRIHKKCGGATHTLRIDVIGKTAANLLERELYINHIEYSLDIVPTQIYSSADIEKAVENIKHWSGQLR